LPINLPAGWDFAKVFGERQPLPVPRKERRADAGDIKTLDAKAQAVALKRTLAVVPPPATVQLPKTATDAELKMIAGAILLALGLILLAWNGRRRFAH